MSDGTPRARKSEQQVAKGRASGAKLVCQLQAVNGSDAGTQYC